MEHKLTATKRDIQGKKLSSLRRSGLVPAVLFDSKTNSQDISVPADVLGKTLRGATATTIFDITLDKDSYKAVIKELQKDPVSEDVIHVAFFKIDENAEMDFELPLVLSGIAPAVKNNLGVLVQPFESIMIRCKPQDLVDSLSIDISLLEHPGQTIKLKEVTLPKGIKLVHAEDIEETIVTITELQKEEEVKPVAAEGEAVEGAAEGETTPAGEEATSESADASGDKAK